MKHSVLIVAATLCLCADALAQSFIALDDYVSTGSLAVNASGNWYGGTFGMEVWVLNGTNIPTGINLSPTTGAGVVGYNAMVAAGFTKETTFSGQATTFPGFFELGTLSMGDVRPAGAEVVMALAAWNNSASSWSAMLTSANQATRAGIIAFDQPTTALLGNPLPPAQLAMNEDLVLSSIPEPSPVALMALSAALLSLARGPWRLGLRNVKPTPENLKTR